MKLLILTQAVDAKHPVLGFFHEWIIGIAARYEKVLVICLQEGEHALPENVRVFSLGKEKHAKAWYRRLIYVANFYKLIRMLRSHYDTVFVHMNPEYVLLGGPLWKAWKKRVVLWYNHPKAGFRFTLAARIADRICYTSPYAASARYVHKAVRMPVGIDTELFKASGERHRTALYMQGRVAPSKRVHVLLEAVRQVKAAGKEISLTLVGPENKKYVAQLKKDFADLVGTVSFLGPYTHAETPELYAAHGMAINLAAAGHFDKSAFEAMATETPVIVSSSAFAGLVPMPWIVPGNDPEALAEAVTRMLELPEETYAALGKEERETVVEKHSLTALMKKLPEVL